MRLRFKQETMNSFMDIIFDKEAKCIRFDSNGKSMGLSGETFDVFMSKMPVLLAGEDISKVKEFLEGICKENYSQSLLDRNSQSLFVDCLFITKLTQSQSELLIKSIVGVMDGLNNEAK